MLAVALLLLACAALVAASASTTVLLRPDSRLDAAVTFGCVASAGVVALGLVLGAIDLLTPAAAFVLVAAWALVGGWLAVRRGWRPHTPSPLPFALRDHPWATAIIAIATVALAWQLVVALILPPFAFDALTYHLTIVAGWVQGESTEPSALSLCCSHYPANTELILTWPVLFGEGDRAVDLAQFPFVALGAVSVAGLTRTAGLPTWAAAAAAGLFVSTPIVLAQAPTDYVDVIVAAWILAGLHSLARFAVTGSRSRLVVAGLAAGLLLGTKGTGFVWGAAIALAALGTAIVLARRARISRRTATAGMIAFSVACLALGSYWYARNWIETGNPAYPFQVEAAGVEVFDGPLQVDEVLTQPDAGADEPWPAAIVRSWASDLDFWNQGSYEYEQRSGGLGPLWPWLALPLLVPLVVWLVRRRSAVLIAFTAMLFVLIVQPYSWWSRFTIPLMGAGALAIVAAATWAPRAWMRRAVQAMALVLALAGVALTSFEVDPAARAEPIRANDVLGLVGAPSEDRTVGRLFFPEYRFLEDVPDDATVVVDLRAPAVRFVYPLFGPEQSRRVVPAGDDAFTGTAWVVTEKGRALDRQLAADPRLRLAAAERGVRVWRPAS